MELIRNKIIFHVERDVKNVIHDNYIDYMCHIRKHVRLIVFLKIWDEIALPVMGSIMDGRG